MTKNILFVAIGGAIGSVLRYAASIAFIHPKFPLNTFLVNCIGCLSIGLLMGYFLKNNQQHSFQLLFVTGLCGGFTTFSAFSYDIVLMLQQAKYTTALLYIFSTLILGILFTIIGLWCYK